MRQYGLVEEAVRLGWAREAVVVIDTDLGVSGRWGRAAALAPAVACPGAGRAEESVLRREV